MLPDPNTPSFLEDSIPQNTVGFEYVDQFDDMINSILAQTDENIEGDFAYQNAAPSFYFFGSMLLLIGLGQFAYESDIGFFIAGGLMLSFARYLDYRYRNLQESIDKREG